jgi:hypothetical protein
VSPCAQPPCVGTRGSGHARPSCTSFGFLDAATIEIAMDKLIIKAEVDADEEDESYPKCMQYLDVPLAIVKTHLSVFSSPKWICTTIWVTHWSHPTQSSFL